MKNIFSSCLLASLFFAFSCSSQKKSFKTPISDLGHIDLILDSTAYFSILQNNFLTGEFSFFTKDTVMYGIQPSYDLYLAGQENFFHISLAKGYWQNKAGSGVLVFQTRKPGKMDSLAMGWKMNYRDSLISHVFNGEGMQLGEVMPYRKKDSLKQNEAIFFPNLTSYSEQTYKNWRFNESDIINGISMKQFMNDWDKSISQKLFKKITELHVQLTQQEFKELSSALKTIGYKSKNESFVHAFNPAIYYKITSENIIPKYTKIVVELSMPVAERSFNIGTTYRCEMKGMKMEIVSDSLN